MRSLTLRSNGTPAAVQIFCAPHAEFTPNTRKSQLLWNETIAAHVEKNGLMVFPALGDDIYDIFTAAGVAPHKYADLDPVDLGRKTGQFYPNDERGRVEVEHQADSVQLYLVLRHVPPRASKQNRMLDLLQLNVLPEHFRGQFLVGGIEGIELLPRHFGHAGSLASLASRPA